MFQLFCKTGHAHTIAFNAYTLLFSETICIMFDEK
jgi:hypothetical protein